MKQPSCGLSNTFANVLVVREPHDSKKPFFIGNKKTKTMSDETDYEALEKSVKYIPWKGKKAEWYTWHKTFLVRAMINRIILSRDVKCLSKRYVEKM